MREVLVGYDLQGVGGHLRAGLADIADETRERDLRRAEACSTRLSGALALITVAFVAAIGYLQVLPNRRDTGSDPGLFG